MSVNVKQATHTMMDGGHRHLTRQEKLTLRVFSKFLLKYTPYFVSVFYVVFCFLRGIGLENMHITMFFAYVGLFWAPYHFASSYSNGFCRWHRHLIWYQGITGTMMFFEIWWGFGPWRIPLNWMFFAWGFILCSMVTYRIHTKQFCENNKIDENDTTGKN